MSLSFNDLRQPQLTYRLKDYHNTYIHVIAPTKDLADKTKANLKNILAILGGDDEDACRQGIYELVVHIMNCNTDGIRIHNIDELADKYGMSILDLADFFIKYTAFLEKIEKEKN